MAAQRETNISISSPSSPNSDPSFPDPVSLSSSISTSRRSSEMDSSAIEEIEDQTSVRLCFICLEEVGGVRGEGNGENRTTGTVKRMKCCLNMVCVKCFSEHVSTQISGGVHIVTCPFCDHILSHEQVMKVSNERNKKLLLRLKMINSLDNKTQKMCPSCDFVQSAPPASTLSDASVKYSPSVTGVVKCDQCGLRWCFPCHSPAHDDKTCEQNQLPDASFVQWKSTIDNDYSPNAQTCPKCFINIQRDGGCSHMKCQRCKTDFCYKCGQSFNHGVIYKMLVGDHYDKYSIVGCPTLLHPKSKAKRLIYRSLACSVRMMVMFPIFLVCVALLFIIIPALLTLMAPVILFLFLGRLFCPKHFRPQRVNNDPV